jgi:hypothetical protein
MKGFPYNQAWLLFQVKHTKSPAQTALISQS